MLNKKYVKDMNYIYYGGANYIFRFYEAIEDLYTLEKDGYMAIRGMSDDWIDESLEVLLKEMSEDVDRYEFEGSISEWNKNKLYIILLSKTNICNLRKYFNTHKKYYFCAEWISYFKDEEILVDIGHAFDGMKEQLSLNDKLSKSKIEELESKRNFSVIWSE